MKFLILLALLGAASATIYGSHYYPEEYKYWGPYQTHHVYGQEGIQYPWYKYGQTFPWGRYPFDVTPFAKHYPSYYYPYVHSPIWSKYQWPLNVHYPTPTPTVWNKHISPLDITVQNHITTYPTPVEKFQHLYPYGEHIQKPYIYGKPVGHVEPVVKSWEHPVQSHLPVVDRFVGLPTYHKEFPVVERPVPFWYKYFGTNPVVPVSHQTTEYLPYFRPYHYGLY